MKAKANAIVGLLAGFVVLVTVARAQEPQQAAALSQFSQADQQSASRVGGHGNDHDNQLRQLFFGSEFARIQRGFEISPVRLNLRGKDLALVGLGSYLANAAGGCNDCHTNPNYAPGGDPFQGQPKKLNAANYLAGGVVFGPFVSRNITPDPDNGNRPAGLTWPQFRQVMRTGIDLKQLHPQFGPLLQVMPWPLYQDLTERDLRALYEYLRSIPHAEPGS